jgi:hypothetical protein
MKYAVFVRDTLVLTAIYSKRGGETMLKYMRLVPFVFLLFMILVPSIEAVPVISVGTYSTPVTTDPFLVPIVITDAVELIAWSFGLTYDPTDLQINDPAALDFLGRPVTEGDFFSSGAPFNLLVPGVIVLDSITLEQIGELFGVEGAFGGFPPGPSGDGILAYVEFVKTASGNGESTITVTDASVTSSAVPEPTTLVLLADGLVFLGVLRLTRKKGRNVC